MLRDGNGFWLYRLLNIPFCIYFYWLGLILKKCLCLKIVNFKEGQIQKIVTGNKNNTSVTPKQSNATDNNKRIWNQQAGIGVNTCLETTCHWSNWSVASCSQTGIYSLWLLVDFSRVCCSLSRWLSLGNRCEEQTFSIQCVDSGHWLFNPRNNRKLFWNASGREIIHLLLNRSSLYIIKWKPSTLRHGRKAVVIMLLDRRELCYRLDPE